MIGRRVPNLPLGYFPGVGLPKPAPRVSVPGTKTLINGRKPRENLEILKTPNLVKSSLIPFNAITYADHNLSVRVREVAGSNPVAPTFLNPLAEHNLSVPAGGRRCGLEVLKRW